MAFTFRPSKQAEKAIEKIKGETGLKTNSKALEYALENFGLIERELKQTREQLNKTDNELNHIKMTIVNKNESDRVYQKMICDLIPNEK